MKWNTIEIIFRQCLWVTLQHGMIMIVYSYCGIESTLFATWVFPEISKNFLGNFLINWRISEWRTRFCGINHKHRQFYFSESHKIRPTFRGKFLLRILLYRFNCRHPKCRHKLRSGDLYQFIRPLRVSNYVIKRQHYVNANGTKSTYYSSKFRFEIWISNIYV